MEADAVSDLLGAAPGPGPGTGPGPGAVVGSSKGSFVPSGKRHDRANSIPFIWLCEMLERIECESGRESKVKILFSQDTRDKVGDQSIYPILRLVLPDSDSLRPKYGVKTTALGKLYIEALRLAPNSEEARKISEWKLNKMNTTPLDIADCIYAALKSRIDPNGRVKHTIGQVNELLDKLANTRPKSFRAAASEAAKEKSANADPKIEIIKGIVENYPPLEQKWLIRIIIGSSEALKIGLNRDPVLRFLNPNAVQKYNECSDLRRACEDASVATTLEVGIPCSPMLSKYFPASKTGKLGVIGTSENAMRTGSVAQPFVMDKKIDGERMLVHCSGRGAASLVHSFTRNSKDSTELYGPILLDIKECLAKFIEKVILDGEIVLWDRMHNLFVPFGNNVSMSKIERDELIAANARQNSAAASGAGGGSSKPRISSSDESYEHCKIRERFQYKQSVNPSLRAHLDMSGGANDLNDTTRFGLKFIVFDVLFLEGEGIDTLFRDCAASVEQLYGIGRPQSMTQGQITHFPLAMRRLILRQLFTPVEHRFEFIEHEIVSSGDRKLRCDLLGSYFDRTVSKNEEGLVIKNLASSYVLGEESRGKNAGWIKIKPEYNDQTQPLDLLIVGGYVGEGKGYRGEGLAGFLLACRADLRKGETEEEFAQSPRFVPVGKVGSGFNFECLRKLRAHFDPVQIFFKKPGQRRQYPSWLVGLPNAPVALKSDDVPDFLIPPHKSKVVTIKCSAITSTDDFPTGFTARFPRLDADTGIRDDKDYLDIMTVSQLAEFQKQGNLSLSEAEAAQQRKRGGGAGGGGSGGNGAATKVQVLSKVPEHFKVNSAAVKQKTKIFAGLKFWLSDTFLPGSQQYGLDLSKVGVDVLVRENGGTIMASADPTTIVLVGTGKPENLQLKNIKKAGTHDILSVGFVVDSVRMQRLVDKKPSHYLCQTDATRQAMRAAGFDALGDHVAEDTSVEELRMLLSCIDLKNLNALVGPALATPATGAVVGGTGAGAKRLKVEKRSEEEEAALRACDRERARILKEASRLSTQGWRDIAAAMTLEERAVVEGSHNAFWNPGNVIYLDLYSSLGPMEKAAGSAPRPAGDLLKHPSPALVALRHRLPLRGAVLAPSLHVGVTHVIVDPVDTGRFQALRERRRLLRLESGCLFEKHFVTAAWAESVIEKGHYSVPSHGDLADLETALAV